MSRIKELWDDMRAVIAALIDAILDNKFKEVHNGCNDDIH